MRSDAQPQQFAPSVAQNQKPVQQSKGDRRHDEHVNRCDAVGMIAKKGFPTLTGWPPVPDHVLCHAGLADIDAEFEKFTMDARRTPERVCNAHFSNELANFGCYSWPATLRS